VQRSSRSI